MKKTLIIELLDNDLGHSIQSWEIETKYTIQIGRSGDADVVIRNPYVSRCHACLVPEESGWVLHSISHLGILYEGQVVNSVPLNRSMEFRLSRKGPLLRIKELVDQSEILPDDDLNAMQTISQDDYCVPLLILDREKRDQEVSEIEKENYFSSLKAIASRLREQNRSGR